jgi:hypothetical protein
MRPLWFLFSCGFMLLSSVGLGHAADLIAAGDNALLLRRASVFVEA